MAKGKPFRITIDERDLIEVSVRLGLMYRDAPAVMARALNQTLTVMNNYIPKQLKREYTYKRVLQTPTKKRAKYSNLHISLKYDPIPFERIQDISYKSFLFLRGSAGNPRNTPGIKFKTRVRRYDEPWKQKDRVFMANNIFYRRKRGERQYPIFYAVGPSETTMVKNVWYSEATQNHIGNILKQKMDKQIEKQLLKKWGGK